MEDRELKKLLLETCPIRPGQESRAWMALRNRIANPETARPTRKGLSLPTWAGAVAVAILIFVIVPAVADLVYVFGHPKALATADSQAPGVYATAFYSRSADAQVVWLNGMEPASDRPTYLDPTTVIANAPDTRQPAGDPNSL